MHCKDIISIIHSPPKESFLLKMHWIETWNEIRVHYTPFFPLSKLS